MVFLHPQLFAVVKWLSILYLFVFYVTLPVYWCVEKLLESPDTAAGGGGGVNATVVAEVPRGEGRDEGWRIVAERIDYNYKKQARAQEALAKLMKVYENSKRDNRHRFRSGSSYDRQLLECELFEQGIDMIFLEMRLRMEFHPTLLSTLVQESWEEAAFDEVYNEWMEELDVWGVEGGKKEKESGVPDEGAVVPGGVASTGANGGGEEDDVPDEEVVFPVPGGEEEEDDVSDEGVVVPGEVASTGANGGREEDDVPGEGVVVPGEEVDLVQEVQVLSRKRKRGRSEAEALRSDLGKYWEASSNGGTVCRRSCRTRRPPLRYAP